MYNKCALQKKCIPGVYYHNVPNNRTTEIKKDTCTPGKTCHTMLSFGNDDGFENELKEDELHLELIGMSKHWVAVGFSRDYEMVKT